MFIEEFYGIDNNLDVISNEKPHTIIAALYHDTKDEEAFLVSIDPNEIEQWVLNHNDHSGYWHRCANVVEHWNEGELDDMGFVQGMTSKHKELDWEAFMKEVDKAIILEFIIERSRRG